MRLLHVRRSDKTVVDLIIKVIHNLGGVITPLTLVGDTGECRELPGLLRRLEVR